MGIEMLDKSFNDLFEDYITALLNQDPDIDVSSGSLERMRGAAYTAAAWGILQAGKYILKQIHPDSSDTQELEHHCSDFGIDRNAGESDKDYLDRLLNRLQNPPASGNDNDHETWAMEIENAKRAVCYALINGPGTVGILVIADDTVTGSEVASSHTGISGSTDSVSAGKLPDSGATFVTDGVAIGDLAKNETTGEEARVSAVDSEVLLTLDADIFPASGDDYSIDSLVTQVRGYLLTLDQPICDPSGLSVFTTSIQEEDVTMVMAGGNKQQAAADVAAYMNGLLPNETMFRAQLIAIAIENGATNVNITVPAVDVTPAAYATIRPGNISVT